MATLSARKWTLAIAIVAVSVPVAILLSRDALDPLNQSVLDAARERWNAAGINDYNLRYTMAGGDYLVHVRQGRAVRVELDGSPTTTNEPQRFSVDGLFDVLQMELDAFDRPDTETPSTSQEAQSTPTFGHAIMRVRFHPRHGYPERYLRTVTGTGRSHGIEALSLAPVR